MIIGCCGFLNYYSQSLQIFWSELRGKGSISGFNCKGGKAIRGSMEWGKGRFVNAKNKMEVYFNQFFCREDSSYAVIIEDDTRVAYAYLLRNNEIVSDVWLYNSMEPPDVVDWKELGNAPFFNTAEYTDDLGNGNTDVLGGIEITWSISKKVSAFVELNNGVKALLKEGAKPGWSNNVKKSGPLALQLIAFNDKKST